MHKKLLLFSLMHLLSKTNVISQEEDLFLLTIQKK